MSCKQHDRGSVNRNQAIGKTLKCYTCFLTIEAKSFVQWIQLMSYISFFLVCVPVTQQPKELIKETKKKTVFFFLSSFCVILSLIVTRSTFFIIWVSFCGLILSEWMVFVTKARIRS